MTLSPLEKKLKDATNNDNCVPNSSLMFDISQVTYTNEYNTQAIVNYVWRGLRLPRKEWRRIYKILNLVDYLLRYSSESCVARIREGSLNFNPFQDFSFLEKGEEKGGGGKGYLVRQMHKVVVSLLLNYEELQEARSHISEYSDRYIGISPENYEEDGAAASASVPPPSNADNEPELPKAQKEESKKEEEVMLPPPEKSPKTFHEVVSEEYLDLEDAQQIEHPAESIISPLDPPLPLLPPSNPPAPLYPSDIPFPLNIEPSHHDIFEDLIGDSLSPPEEAHTEPAIPGELDIFSIDSYKTSPQNKEEDLLGGELFSTSQELSEAFQEESKEALALEEKRKRCSDLVLQAYKVKQPKPVFLPIFPSFSNDRQVPPKGYYIPNTYVEPKVQPELTYSSVTSMYTNLDLDTDFASKPTQPQKKQEVDLVSFESNLLNPKIESKGWQDCLGDKSKKLIP